MKIEDLTIGQAQHVAAMFNVATNAPNAPPWQSELVGEYVIVRCHDAGVHSGVLVWHQGRECMLTDSRRLWRWKSAKGISLSDVAVHGLDGSESKISSVVEEILLTENCEIIKCSETGEASLRGAAINE